MVKITTYKNEHKKEWLRCRLLSFFETCYYDDVITKKPHYLSAIELVALSEDNCVIGLLDLEINDDNTATIWELAVHPDHQKSAVASKLFRYLIKEAEKKGLHSIDAWTREDVAANSWYRKMKFEMFSEYWHLYSHQLPKESKINVPNLYPAHIFWHFTGDDLSTVDISIDKKYQCRGYKLKL